jgi:hypothetical protein
MVWDSVAHLFVKVTEKQAEIPVETKPEEIPAWQVPIDESCVSVEAFLVAKGQIKEGQTWRDCSDKALKRIASDVNAFLAAVASWKAGK